MYPVTQSPVLLLGGTGYLGREIATELYKHGYRSHALVRNMARAAAIRGLATRITKIKHLEPSHFEGVDTVISALGKSVSPLDKSRFTFAEVDENIHLRAIRMAADAGVRKFIYVSVFNADMAPDLEYCRVHSEVENALAASRMEYTIIRPVALFSAFRDLFDMARKGRLMNLGKGRCRTNPIHEKDVAKLCVKAIDGRRRIIPAGGPVVYTRSEINEIIASSAGRKHNLLSVPAWPVKAVLPVLKMTDRNLYDKMKFFMRILETDVIAPVEGHMRFENYLDTLSKPSRRFWDLPSDV
ncbi:SDR family oxidoreductase [Chitinophaga lutea]